MKKKQPTKLKLIRGAEKTYTENLKNYEGFIYLTTDTQALYLNGNCYGHGDAEKEVRTVKLSKGDGSQLLLVLIYTDRSSFVFDLTPFCKPQEDDACTEDGDDQKEWCITNGILASSRIQELKLPVGWETDDNKLLLGSKKVIGVMFPSESLTNKRIKFSTPGDRKVKEIEYFNVVSGDWVKFPEEKWNNEKGETTGNLLGPIQMRFYIE